MAALTGPFKPGDRVTNVWKGVSRRGVVTRLSPGSSFWIIVRWDSVPRGWARTAGYDARHLTLESAIDALAKLAP